MQPNTPTRSHGSSSMGHNGWNSSPATSSPPLGAYVAAPMALARERMQTGAPDDRKHELMPAELV